MRSPTTSGSTTTGSTNSVGADRRGTQRCGPGGNSGRILGSGSRNPALSRSQLMPTIAVVGEVVADAVLPPDGIVDGAAHLTVHPGGGPANTAVALSRLGTT